MDDMINDDDGNQIESQHEDDKEEDIVGRKLIELSRVDCFRRGFFFLSSLASVSIILHRDAIAC